MALINFIRYDLSVCKREKKENYPNRAKEIGQSREKISTRKISKLIIQLFLISLHVIISIWPFTITVLAFHWTFGSLDI